MTISYDAPTLTNYNASPPADDGSQTSGNEITWSGIKTKIGDPLKTFAQAIDTELQTEFAKFGTASEKNTGTASTEIPTLQNLWDEGYRPKNFIINQKFDIWQRGTSFTPTDGTYSADRWVYRVDLDSGTLGNETVSRKTHSLGQTDVPYQPKYYCQVGGQVTGSAGNAEFVGFAQRIEGVETLAGTTVTVVFYAKSSTAKTIAVDIRQNFWTTGSPSSDVITTGGTHSITSTWTKFTETISVPSVSGKTLGSAGNDFLEIIFVLDAGASSSYTTVSGDATALDIGHVAVVRGSVDGPIEDRTKEQELASCQRYYQRVPTHVQGVVLSASAVTLTYAFPVQMRAAPTAALLDTTPTVSLNGTSSATTGSSSTISSQLSSADGGYLRIDGFTGLTAKDHVRLAVANVADWSAEL